MSQENYDKLADVMGVPHMDATKLGYINHIPLVWDNEPARHKLLDIIGDLALIGKPIKGRIIATRPGHTINNKFARQIRKEIKLHEIQAPSYNCNESPIMDVNRIRELLPHRYPFQLVDKVVAIGQKVVPGDTLLFRVELLAPIRRGISTMKGYVFVGEKVVCEAEFMAQIVKNK